MDRIYMDHAATTPVNPAVLADMLPFFTEQFGNASSVYTEARTARAAVEKAANFTGLPITEVDSYQSAVALARETARPGDVVLLSPASTSFDRFANFMERGRVFKDLVNALK